MTNEITVEIGANTRYSLLNYYDTSQTKVNPSDSLTFKMFAGLYYYMITAGDNRQFLRAKTKHDLAAKKHFDWTNVKGLEDQLASILVHNIRQYPFLVTIFAQCRHRAVWSNPLGNLANHELRWLRVVNEALKRIHIAHRPGK